MRFFGWSIPARGPNAQKFILLCAPHTSNIDALWFFVAVRALDFKPKVLIKSSFYFFPFRWLFLRLGGVPVERGSKAGGLADQLVDYVKETEEIALCFAQEGSRSYQRYWKSGFYQIALATGLPVYLASVDYPSGTIKISEETMPITGDRVADMEMPKAFYEGIRGKYPDQFGPVELKPERKE